MADQKISELTALTGANVADDDAIAIVDTSATETKKIVFSELKNALDTATGFVRITGDTMTGDLNVLANVGIGTSSPNSYAGYTALTLNNATNGGIIDIERNGTLVGEIFTDDVNTFTLQAVGSKSVNFRTNGTERMRIDSSGNVGIGVSSIQASAAGKTLETSGCLISGGTLNSHQTNRAVIEYNVGANSMNIRAYGATAGSGIMTFATGGGGGSTDSEAMRIDSSGNLLVGQSTTTVPGVGNTTAGVSIRGDDGSFFSRSLGSGDTNSVVTINRSSNDGNILGFAKDGTTVGSIGVAFSSSIAIDGAANRSGVYLATSSLVPRYNASNIDATVDLGGTSTRFKDLYLSGGVYLGGTGAANKLDDYEEGTWTITDGSGAGLSFTVQDNVYTKIGRLVVASAIITWPSTSNTSAARIVLPFTSIANNSHSGGVVTEQNWDTSITLTASCNYTNGVIFRQRGGSSLTNANLSGKKLRFTITYHAA